MSEDYKIPEFVTWYEALTRKQQHQIDARIYRIEEYNHFGDTKFLSEGLSEMRWTNGRRVYFIRGLDQFGEFAILLVGGLKNAKKKDIKEARLLIQKYASLRA